MAWGWEGGHESLVPHAVLGRELRWGMLPGLLAGSWALQESLEGGWQVLVAGDGETAASC